MSYEYEIFPKDMQTKPILSLKSHHDIIPSFFPHGYILENQTFVISLYQIKKFLSLENLGEENFYPAVERF